MKQWITNQDGLENLQLVTDAPMPEGLKEGEVLVKVNRVSLNYRDTEVCMGLYKHHKYVPSGQSGLVPCSDICGTITKVSSSTGDKVEGFKEGDRVMATFNQTHVKGQIVAEDMASGLGLPLAGCLTEYRIFPATGLVKVPDYLSDEEAACLPIAAVTAWMSINSFQPLGQPMSGKDKVVLLQGTGGVAISGLQIAKALGLTTIITSSSDAKLERARKMGADHTINYKSTPDWHEEVLRITDNKGADVVFETGGAQTLAKSFECVAFGGLISCIGYLSGKEDSPGNRINTNVLALKRNVTLKGMLNGSRERFEEMLRCVYTGEQEKQIHPVVDKVFKFEEAKEAFQYLFQGGHFGKVVIQVS
ncbi:NAD(P)-binding protein [Apiospora arundinis]|uniref:NAD(P)-binding protein n=1 Tax=Apiospora arundinis TaxID=335852 RepID=A0ABR2I4J8_9PEZI